jgi:hypothetical protein
MAGMSGFGIFGAGLLVGGARRLLLRSGRLRRCGVPLSALMAILG